MKRKPLSTIKELDAEAKREWKNVLRFKDENQLLFISFVLLIAAAVIINTVYVINRSDEAPNNTAASQANSTTRIQRSLDTALSPVAMITVNNISENSSPDPAFPLRDDYTLLSLDISITNRSSATQQLIPTSQLFVHDRDGGHYPLQASIRLTHPLAAQALKAGQSAQGQIAFAVPKRQTSPLLFIDLGWDKSVPIVYDVLH